MGNPSSSERRSCCSDRIFRLTSRAVPALVRSSASETAASREGGLSTWVPHGEPIFVRAEELLLRSDISSHLARSPSTRPIIGLGNSRVARRWAEHLGSPWGAHLRQSGGAVAQIGYFVSPRAQSQHSSDHRPRKQPRREKVG